MSKVKVLVIMYDVSDLSEDQIEELQAAAYAQSEGEDFDAPILNDRIAEFDSETMEEVNEEDTNGNFH